MVSKREAKKLKDLEKVMAGFDAFENSIHYFKMLIDADDVSELCERLQECLLARRHTATLKFHEEYDRIFAEENEVISPEETTE